MVVALVVAIVAAYLIDALMAGVLFIGFCAYEVARWRGASRRRSRWIAGGVILAGLIVGLIVWWWAAGVSDAVTSDCFDGECEMGASIVQFHRSAG